MVKNRLKELRTKHKYTLDDIEEKTGIKRGTYNNYENGKTEPKLETWKKLADFYSVPVSYLQGINDVKVTFTEYPHFGSKAYNWIFNYLEDLKKAKYSDIDKEKLTSIEIESFKTFELGVKAVKDKKYQKPYQKIVKILDKELENLDD